MELEQISPEILETIESMDTQGPEQKETCEECRAATLQESCQEDQQTETEEASDVQATILSLNTRIRELEDALNERQALSERMTRECEEFEAYFPEVSLRKLPDEVWEQVHAGVPLAAAYALYERGVRNRAMAAEEQNARNAAHLPAAPAQAQSRYFSPAQVRAMSRREVRENYDRIFESMRHWQ